MPYWLQRQKTLSWNPGFGRLQRICSSNEARVLAPQAEVYTEGAFVMMSTSFASRYVCIICNQPTHTPCAGPHKEPTYVCDDHARDAGGGKKICPLPEHTGKLD